MKNKENQEYKLWEILKMKDDGSLKSGDKFKALELPIDLIIEFNGDSFEYNTVMGDSTTKDSVTLCSGELNSKYIKFQQEMIKLCCPSCGKPFIVTLEKNIDDEHMKKHFDCECGSNFDMSYDITTACLDIRTFSYIVEL